MTVPLTNLTKKGASNTVAWIAEHEHAFDELRKKRRPPEPPVLRAPDTPKTFVVLTDASDTSLGAVLLQEHEGILHPVAYASRKLSESETQYLVHRKRMPSYGLGDSKILSFFTGTTLPYKQTTSHINFWILPNILIVVWWGGAKSVKMAHLLAIKWNWNDGLIYKEICHLGVPFFSKSRTKNKLGCANSEI